MKIMIIGGGIGGLTTAVSLRHFGFEPHVYESASEIRPVGKGIWLPTNAMLVMERLGLADTLADQGVPLDAIQLEDKSGTVLQTIDLQQVRQRFGRTTTSIMRADLQASLAAALPPDSIHLNKRCVSVTQDADRVTVQFDDETAVSADLVIGADGIRSNVREAVQPNVPLRYAGQTCYLGIAAMNMPHTHRQTVREIWGGDLRFGYSAVGPNKIYWFAPQTAPASGQPAPKMQTLLAQQYADFPDPVAEIIRHTAEADIMRVDLNDFAPLPTWHSGRVLLLGDADHAMTPNLGQGGAQAIEDGLALAQFLSQSASMPAALEQFVALRQPKTSRIVKTAWRFGQIAHLRQPLLRQLRNLAFRLTPHRIKQQQVEAIYQLNF